jgi:hypothetical protein
MPTLPEILRRVADVAEQPGVQIERISILDPWRTPPYVSVSVNDLALVAPTGSQVVRYGASREWVDDGIRWSDIQPQPPATVETL